MTSEKDLDEAIKRIDLRLLHYFSAAGKLQHITRAAALLGTSQPTLSRALTRLEAELGVQLFQRRGRSVCLTPDGETLLGYVDRALQFIDDGRRQLQDRGAAAQSTISLGFLRSLGAKFVPGIVRRFKEYHPNVNFSFTTSTTSNLLERLGDRELDVVFLLSSVKKEGFDCRRVAFQDLVLIVPSAHRLAHSKRVSLRHLAHEPFISYKPGREGRDLTIELCERAGFTPSIVLEADDPTVIRGFVAEGFGVAIALPENAGEGVRALQITEPKCRREIRIAWRKNSYLSHIVRSFLAFAVSERGVVKRGG
jgi:DNA-binding transcriptional LysR family regulator